MLFKYDTRFNSCISFYLTSTIHVQQRLKLIYIYCGACMQKTLCVVPVVTYVCAILQSVSKM